jgi:hypothetical protein
VSLRVFRVVNIGKFLPMSAIRTFLGNEAVLSDEEEATILHFQQDHALQRLEVAPLRAPGVEIPTRVVMSQ